MNDVEGGAGAWGVLAVVGSGHDLTEMMMVGVIGTPDLNDDFHCYSWRKKVLNGQKTRQKLLSLL